MEKIVINKCYGGYGLSDQALDWLKEKDSFKNEEQYQREKDCFKERGMSFFLMEDRSNPLLIECVETLKEKASGQCSNLVVEEVFGIEDVTFEIESHGGFETIKYFFIQRD